MEKKRKANKSQAIRDAHRDNPDWGPKKISERLSLAGVKVSAAFVSTVKTMDKTRAAQLAYAGIDPSTDMIQLIAAKQFAASAGGIDEAIASLVSLKKLRSE